LSANLKCESSGNEGSIGHVLITIQKEDLLLIHLVDIMFWNNLVVLRMYMGKVTREKERGWNNTWFTNGIRRAFCLNFHTEDIFSLDTTWI